ncbi:MAG: hypothetical protein AB7T37_09760 [Dehalococcoidia bacterium]
MATLPLIGTRRGLFLARDRIRTSSGSLRQHNLVFVDGAPVNPGCAISPNAEILVVPARLGG